LSCDQDDRLTQSLGIPKRFEDGVSQQDVLLYAVGRTRQFGKVVEALLCAFGLASTFYVVSVFFFEPNERKKQTERTSKQGGVPDSPEIKMD